MKVSAGTGAGHAVDVALEDLDALAVAFLNAVVNLDVVGDANLRNVLAGSADAQLRGCNPCCNSLLF